MLALFRQISLRGADTSLKFGMNFAQYVAMHAKKTANTTDSGRCWCVVDSLHLLGVRSNSFVREHESKESDRRLVNLALFLVESEV